LDPDLVGRPPSSWPARHDGRSRQGIQPGRGGVRFRGALMPRDRLLRILARLSSGDAAEPDAARLCEVSADVALISRAGSILLTPKSPQVSGCSSSEVSAPIQQLQFTLGEGPCIDACTLGRPVLEPDLDAPRTRRWIAFTPAAVGAGARAVFGFPLHVGAV